MNPYLYAYMYHFPRVVAKAIVGKRFRKDSARVYEHYEAKRRVTLEQFRADQPPVEEFIANYAEPPQLQMLDNRPSWDLEAVRRRFIDDLAARIERYRAGSVIEIGSGHGRNVLALKKRFPSLHAEGFELSHASVRLAQEAAAEYGIDAMFRQFDATGDWSIVPEADLIFTMHALEQMPDDAARVIDHMVRLARRAVVMFEPFPDFWSGPKGFARKMRAIDSHRLRAGSFKRYQPVEARSLDYGDVINHPSLVVIET